jgi:hypothetical protein
MRLRNAGPAWLLAIAGSFIPTGASAVGPSAALAPVAVFAATGAKAVRVTGTLTGARPFQVVLYATFAPDLPVVLLGRRPLPADADGHFDAIVPIAPAYFVGTSITVVVQTAAGVSIASGSVTLPEPSIPRAPNT